ncbi:hypothetical protein PILCRDRAFT_91592 [Piloderma croceum F 1598]|uniref:Uncharacterized protein n=1 Tax=Piloderma croceum (strain F 1598) TaxID=765440 RepID=A0A0C3EVI1_PILCF|nr:hypothetical protein PILCRDRAFT_91592 [Piloderma croceum F 1598]
MDGYGGVRKRSHRCDERGGRRPVLFEHEDGPTVCPVRPVNISALKLCVSCEEGLQFWMGSKIVAVLFPVPSNFCCLCQRREADGPTLGPGDARTPNGATLNRARIRQSGRVEPFDGFQQLDGEVESGVGRESVCGYDMVCYKFVIGLMEHAGSAPLASMHRQTYMLKRSMSGHLSGQGLVAATESDHPSVWSDLRQAIRNGEYVFVDLEDLPVCFLTAFTKRFLTGFGLSSDLEPLSSSLWPELDSESEYA